MNITNLLNYNRQIMAASEEREIFDILIRFAMELTGAAGVSYVPLDENGQPAAVVRQGEFPKQASDAWLEYLAFAPVRQSCQQCNQREALAHSCPLAESLFSGPAGVYCMTLQLDGQELGVLNIFQPEESAFEAENQEVLSFALDVTTYVFQVHRLQQREQKMAAQLHSVRAGENPDLALLQYQTMIEERSRLGREIHDGLAQTLGFLKLQTAQMQTFLDRQDYDRVRKIARSCYKTLTEAYQDAREAIDNLRVVPGEDIECSLQEWLLQTVKSYQQDEASSLPFSIELHCDEQPVQLPPEIQAQLIRIAQEALSNIRKHAHATQAEITCGKIDGDFILEVRDNGCGFIVDDVPGLTQHGLRGMRERSELIGADFRVTSGEGKGTTVSIRLPFISAQEMEKQG